MEHWGFPHDVEQSLAHICASSYMPERPDPSIYYGASGSPVPCQSRGQGVNVGGDGG